MGRKLFNRSDRLAPIIRNAVGSALTQRIRDPRLAGVSVTDVRVSPDLRLARIYVHSMEPDADPDAVVEALEAATPVFRREVNERARLRYMPELKYHYDATIERAQRIEDILSTLDIPPDDEDDSSAEEA